MVLVGHSFVRPRQSHSSVPTADFSRRRVERQSRTALLQRRRRLVLDGREHDGTLPRIGAEGDRQTVANQPVAQASKYLSLLTCYRALFP